MLTGNKDVDRKILNNLEDKDLVNVCQTNKKANSLCNDQVFWMNRVFQKFGYVGGDVLRQNKKERSWSEYYIQDLRKINKTNAYHNLWKESRNGRLDLVIIALKNEGNNHTKYDLALKWATECGHLEMVKYLVSQGADIHGNNDQVLRQASAYGHLEIVKYLIENGANIHAGNDYVLKTARYHKHLDVVKYLESL